MDLADLALDPFDQFERWYGDVVAARLPEPSAMVLTTADARGRSLGRHVLLKGVDQHGFVWFTNYESAKGRHLSENPWACLVFPWFSINRQVVVTGAVSLLAPAESDAYFASRDRSSQLSAWASVQSRPIPDRAWLEERLADFDRRFAGVEVTRPPHWGGYRLTPHMLEFWQSGPARLHDRFRYTPNPAGWEIERLSP
ncbi:pyridoxamine 5'-phosphate oxidase [soil metagenome]